jgi:taurine dioxygenase
MEIARVSPALGAEVLGIDARSASDSLVAELRQHLHRYHVLILREQDLPHGEMQQFAARWGDLLTHPSGMHPEFAHEQTLARQAVRGKAFSAWHSDMSWHPTPPAITLLHAREVPTSGGDTGFADQKLALETLDDARKDGRRQFRIGLPGIEDLLPLKANHTGKGFGPEVPDSIHPVVRRHDETGELTLYVNPEFTSHLVDVPEEEGRRMLWPLWMHQTCMEFVYRHAWRPGDVVIWDNRYVLHTAILDDDEPRYMIRCTVKGPQPS